VDASLLRFSPNELAAGWQIVEDLRYTWWRQRLILFVRTFRFFAPLLSLFAYLHNGSDDPSDGRQYANNSANKRQGLHSVGLT